MTIGIRKVWYSVNKVLTMINAILVAVLTGNVANPKEVRNVRIPLFANILLLAFLTLGLIAAFYQTWF